MYDVNGVDLSTMTEHEMIMAMVEMKAKKREERRAWEERRAPLKKKELALKRELGRKLTNGEKNFIALSHVSEEQTTYLLSAICRVLR